MNHLVCHASSGRHVQSSIHAGTHADLGNSDQTHVKSLVLAEGLHATPNTPTQSVGHADSVRRFNPCAHWWSCPIRYARTLLKQPALSAGHRHLYDYPTPSHLNVLWEFGSHGGIGLHVQIVTGIVLAMHYTPHVVCAAVSIEHILREVYAGHVLRHAHANGASLFFIAV